MGRCQAVRITRYVRLALYLLVVRRLPESSAALGPLWRRIRGFVARPLFDYAGSGINIEKNAWFGSGSGVRIGDRSGIGVNARLHGSVHIGSNVMMGPDCIIYTRNHLFERTDLPMIDQGFRAESVVTIGDDVWIGARSIILPGVVIGSGAIVGAGAVVTRSVAPKEIVGGNPARRLGTRSGHTPQPTDS